VRVHTLILIRWIAVLGQSFALILVAYGLNFTFPRLPALTVVAASITLNMALSIFYRPGARIKGFEALAHLLFDLGQLSALLYLTGGLANPLCILLIAPVAVSASLLSASVTLALSLSALTFEVLLFYFSLPLPWDGAPPVLPNIYSMGQAIALGFTLIFIAVYALRLSIEARRWQMALAATQNALERETKMSALGALAAAAADAGTRQACAGWLAARRKSAAACAP
jgi:two-component system sensor histidine kinase RegB